LTALETELAAVGSLLDASPSASSIDDISSRSTGCMSVVGQLQGLMDEIDLGEIEDDEARAAARARRKKINAKLEETLEPAAKVLRGRVVSARSKAS
jgi:hypothetical protein